jgi:hypothetical protein
MTFQLRGGDVGTENAGISAYPVVTSATSTAGPTVVPVASSAGAHRYWVVWLTSLPATSDGQFQGSIVDMSFRS